LKQKVETAKMNDFSKIQTAFNNQDYAQVLALGLEDYARTGHRTAQEILGNVYQLGLGLPVDTAQAAFWYQKALDQGSGLAANNLAAIALQGYADHPPNREKSDNLFAQARELKFIHAPRSR
jgi:TPR repeat protein